MKILLHSLIFASFGHCAIVGDTSLMCVRTRDNTTISIGSNEVSFFEIITATPLIRDDNRGAGVSNIAAFVLAPVITIDSRSGNEGLFFGKQVPVVVVSVGKVRSVRYLNRTGLATSPNAMDVAGSYRIEVEFGSAIPSEFTVVVTMARRQETTERPLELRYEMNDDGMGRFGWKTESFLRIVTIPGIQYRIMNGTTQLVSNRLGWTTLDANKKYTIHLE